MYIARAGDQFCFEIRKREFLSGRVLLDVETQCVAPQRVKPNSRLAFFNGGMLLEIYAESMRKPGINDSKVLVPSLFLPASGFSSGHWKVLGHKDVDPKTVDFPMSLVLVGPHVHFSWGELALPMKMTFAEMQEIGVRPTFHTSTLDLLCLVALGREAEVDKKRAPDPEQLRLERSDLRFLPLLGELLERAGLPPRPNYFDEALARGFDLRRFYEPGPLVPFLVCPYCWSIRTPEEICWACGEDTSRDAAIEVTQDELDQVERKTCPKCHERIPVQALRCLKCRTEQPEEGD
jgi:ribosomal protein L40E